MSCVFSSLLIFASDPRHSLSKAAMKNSIVSADFSNNPIFILCDDECESSEPAHTFMKNWTEHREKSVNSSAPTIFKFFFSFLALIGAALTQYL